MKDNKKHKKAEYGILITGLIILLAATFVIALCAGQYSVSVPEVTKILASRFVNVTKTWSNTAEGVVFTLRLPRIIGAVLVGSALSLSGAAYQGVFKNPLVAPDLLGVSSGACVGASVAILLHLNSFGVQAMAFVAGILAVGLTLFIPRLIKNTNMTMLVLSGIIVKGIMDSVMGIIKYVADPETELQSITYWQLGSLTKVLPKDLFTVGPVIMTTHMPDHAMMIGGKTAILGRDGTLKVGKTEEIITEKKLEELYQVKTRIVYIPEVGRKVCVVAEQ